MARVLVTGGAGYVGSAACAYLLARGHEVHILDNLSRGREDLLLAPLTRASVGDADALDALLSQKPGFDCVMHFAAFALVAESVADPKLYWENNVEQSQSLLAALERHGVKRIVFSSTCAVFGSVGTQSIREDQPKNPINPYGETKLAVEAELARWCERSGGSAVALRYFNAAGAEEGLRVGERHDPETHLIPRIFMALSAHQPVEVYGTDYSTPDGTCIRDYIHVSDLAQAHESAMLRMLDGHLRGFHALNLGSEKGYSVREVIRTCEQVVGHRIVARELPRRAGDPPRLVADSTQAQRVLRFRVRHDLRSIIQSAWNYHRKIHGQIKRAVFLDRDGTLNVDPGYLNRADQLQLLPGVGEALSELSKKGQYALVVVTNQSGIGRGLITPEQLSEVHERLQQMLADYGVQIDRFEVCPHRPDEGCVCRKPSSELLLRGARALGVPLEECVMIGDKPVDVLAGRAAGCRSVVLVKTGEGALTSETDVVGQAHFVAAGLPEAARWILDSSR